MKITRCIITVCLFITIIVTVALPSFALDITNEDWERFDNSVPSEAREAIGEDAFSDSGTFADNVSRFASPDFFIKAVLDTVGMRLGSAAALLALLCTAVMLSGIIRTAASGMDNPAFCVTVEICTTSAVALPIIYTVYSHFDVVGDFFSKLSLFTEGLFPLTACLWAMGGNVSTASVGGVTFGVMSGLCESLWAKTAIPVCSALTVLGISDAMCEGVRTGKVMNAIRKIYNFILTATMTVLLTSLAGQTAIAAAADSTASRTAKFVASNAVPVVGGSIGDTFRTVGAGVAYLKNVFGFGGIMILILLLLPPLVTVLLTRAVFMLSAGLADMLGCSKEASLLDNMSEVYGCISGVVLGASVMLIISLCVFMKTTVAVA